jgi:pyruvate dehydrogenase phosphatase
VLGRLVKLPEKQQQDENVLLMEAVPLSNDHNTREPVEQAKLRRLHPNEVCLTCPHSQRVRMCADMYKPYPANVITSQADIIKCKRETSCYVKGKLQPTRSLGDAYLKYSEFNGQPGMDRSAGRYLPPPYTPPYITADPEV